MSVQLDSNYDRINLSLLGWLKDHVIIASGPQLREVELTSRDHCVVRFVKDGTAYGFYTKMLSKVLSPVPMIFFRYPENVSSLAFRKATRVKTNIPAKMMGLKGRQDLISGNAEIMDLSETGCLLELPASKACEIKQGDDFYLTFKIWEDGLELDCAVRNIRKNGDHYLIGIAFKNLSENCKEILQNFECMVAVSDRKVPS